MTFVFWLIANYQTIITAALAVVVAITHFVAIFPLPQANPVVKVLNKVAGNYGYANNPPSDISLTTTVGPKGDF